MLPKAQRLSSKEIVELKKNSKRVASTLFSVLYKQGETSRFSVFVPKKVYKSAVGRNTAKRKVISALEKISPMYSGDYSIGVQKPINELPFLEIEKELIRILCHR